MISAKNHLASRRKDFLEKAFPGWENLESRKTKRRVKLGASCVKYAENKEMGVYLEGAAQKIFLEYCHSSYAPPFYVPAYYNQWQF